MKYVLTSYRITYILLAFCFISGFIQRFTSSANKIVLFFFTVVSLLLILNNQLKGKKRQSPVNYTYVWVILLAFLMIAVSYGLVPNFLFELLIIASFFFPLCLLAGLSYNEKVKLIRFVLVVSFLQIFIDIALPNSKYSLLDQYAGTFESGNNKARFLMFPVFLLVAAFKNKQLRKDIFKTLSYFKVVIFFLPILVSVYLGHSAFSLLFFGAALMFGILIKKFRYFLLLNSAGFISICLYITGRINRMTNYDLLWWVYYRFLDPANGILACYIYGWKLFKGSTFVGVGIGNFATRASIFFETPNAYGYPAVNIEDAGIDFSKFNAINPPTWGMSSIYLFLVEGGFLVLPLFFIFFRKLWRDKAPNYLGLSLFFYIFYVVNYWPQFFEDYSCYLYLVMFYLINDIVAVNINRVSKPIGLRNENHILR